MISPSDYWTGDPYKGQLHSHTTNSDGADSPANLVTAYKSKGYDFIAITDHDYITPDPGISGITFIQSIEELAGINHPHVAAWDVTDQSTSTDPATVIQYHTDRGRMTDIAHPEYSPVACPLVDMITYYANGYRFTEVWNGIAYATAETSWDGVLSAGNLIYGLAVDDCHGITRIEFNSGWVVVFAASNSKSDILTALASGNFYATTGNDIGVKRDGDTIYAASSWFSNIQFIGQNGTVLKECLNTCRAFYDLAGTETYVRVKSTRVTDVKTAWGQPIFIS